MTIVSTVSDMKTVNARWFPAVLIVSIIPASAPASEATRGLSDYSAPSVPFTVTITLDPPPDTWVVGVEDSPPAGWTDIQNISDGGSYDAENHKVKFGPFFDPSIPTSVTYDLTPPGIVTETDCFLGAASFDGSNETIEGDSCLVCAGECDDGDPCTANDVCIDGNCTGTPVGIPYGDVNGDGFADIDDTLTTLAAFGGDYSGCHEGTLGFCDIFPCIPDGFVDIDDSIATLSAFAGNPACSAPCP